MVWIRLIGGLHDGEVSKVDADQIEIVLRRNVPTPATRAFARTFGLAARSAEIVASRYTRRGLTTLGGKEIVYFASENLSDLESLRHVLGP